jgi:hypothetical protein
MINWKDEIMSMIDSESGEVFEYSNPPIDSVEMTTDFDNGYGSERGCPFIAFSNTNVYFPVCYDGSEWVGSAPRNYPANPQQHQGG